MRQTAPGVMARERLHQQQLPAVVAPEMYNDFEGALYASL